MVTVLLVVVLLTVVVFIPLLTNWERYKRSGILRRQLMAFALIVAGICGAAILFDVADSWRLYAAAHGARAANHLLYSPFALTGAALTLACVVQTVFPSKLMPVLMSTRREAVYPEKESKSQPVPATNNGHAPVSLPPLPTPIGLSQEAKMHTKEDLRFTFDVKLKTKPRVGDMIVIGPEATAGCLHEAGHCLLHVLRGDILLSVWYRAEPHFDPQLMKPVAGAGATQWRILDHNCSCGGFVRPLPGNQFLDEEEQRNGFTAGLVSLRPQCPKCMRYTVTYLAAIYAGSAATECYMPKYHDPSENYFDDLDAERWFENLPWLVPLKTHLISRAKTLAAEIIRREQKALTALCMLVAFNQSPVDGKDAERTIKENLVSTSLGDYTTIQ